MKKVLLLASIGLFVAISSVYAGKIPAPMFPDSGCWGVVYHKPGHIKSYAEEIPLLKNVGVQWVRINIRWYVIEKGKRGNYDWKSADEIILPYLKANMKVMCVLTVENLCSLYKGEKKDVVIDAIARWMGKAAERYKGRGIVWEISNEPECFPMDGYWNNPVTYTQMAGKSAAAIKKADPLAKVAALSTAWMDKGFILKSLQAGLLDDGTIDIITFHGYYRRTILPESGLAQDVNWLRRMIRKYRKKNHHVIVVDSERGYAIVKFLSAKDWSSWRNQVYTREEQAAYLARHYLTEISLGVEISVWYKACWGESSFSLYSGGKGTLTPMGYVYKNLSTLLPENPKLLFNNKYPVALVDLPDKICDPNTFLKIKSCLKSYLKKGEDKEVLVIALWNPIEAFAGRILESRKRIGDDYYEAWRAISPSDHVEVPVKVNIGSLTNAKVVRCYLYNLLAKNKKDLTKSLSISQKGPIGTTDTVKVGPMPTVIVMELQQK